MEYTVTTQPITKNLFIIEHQLQDLSFVNEFKSLIDKNVGELIDEMKRLAGIPSTQSDVGMNMSVTGTQKGELMKKNNIQPGTPEWFKLWFSLPYMTGEKPIGK